MKIIFICTGNTCRSPMAEGLFKKYITEYNINAACASAGIMVVPGSCVSNYSVEALKKYDIDISDHIPNQITEDILNDADLVITMSASHKDYLHMRYPENSKKIFAISEYSGGKDIHDPYGGDFQTYELCADEINYSIPKLIERIMCNE